MGQNKCEKIKKSIFCTCFLLANVLSVSSFDLNSGLKNLHSQTFDLNNAFKDLQNSDFKDEVLQNFKPLSAVDSILGILGSIPCALDEAKNESISDKCFKQMKIVCENPLLMFQFQDASSRYLTQSVLYASPNDLGNFDYCVTLEYKNKTNINGKFCPYAAIAHIPHLMNEEEKQNPKAVNYTPIGLRSMCVPDACTPKEVASVYRKWFNIFYQIVPEESALTCSIKDSEKEMTPGTLAVAIIFGIVLFLLILSTSYDVYLHYAKKKEFHLIAKAFSMFYNGSKIVSVTKNTGEQILSINGLRFISMAWVIAGHGLVAWEQANFSNYGEITPELWQSYWYSQYIGAAPFSVDTFFFISGLLLSYGYIKVAKNMSLKKQIMGIPTMYLHRYLRLTPALASVYLFNITLMKYFSYGPLWPLMFDVMSKPCINHPWRFFLYVQNYFDEKEMCLTQTWYLAADMQMFILAPIILLPIALYIEKHFKKVMAFLVVLTVCFTILPMAIRFALPDYGNGNDFSTHSKFTTYTIGMMTGIILRTQKNKKYPFGTKVNLLIWAVAIIALLAIGIGLHSVLGDDDFVTEHHTNHVLYYGFQRPLWSLCLGWIVYSCYFGYGGFVNWFLSAQAFQVGGRLSYCMYLMHGTIIVTWIAMVQNKLYFNDYIAYYYWCGHFITTMFVAVIWTLAFESPMIIIDKLLIQSLDKLVSPKKQPKKENVP